MSTERAPVREAGVSPRHRGQTHSPREEATETPAGTKSTRPALRQISAESACPAATALETAGTHSEKWPARKVPARRVDLAKRRCLRLVRRTQVSEPQAEHKEGDRWASVASV